MEKEELKELLNELAEFTKGPARPGLGEQIKHRIPQTLSPHKHGTDTIHIAINLRISKLAAAAVIIITILLCANLFGGRDWTSDGIVGGIRESLAWLGAGRADILAVRSKYEDLARQGKVVVYYGDSIDTGDDSAVLMQLKTRVLSVLALRNPEVCAPDPTDPIMNLSDREKVLEKHS